MKIFIHPGPHSLDDLRELLGDVNHDGKSDDGEQLTNLEDLDE